MTLVQITNYTSPNCTDRPQVNVHCTERFFQRMPVRIYLHRSKKVISNCRWLSKLSSKMDLKRPAFRSFCSCSWNVVVNLNSCSKSKIFHCIEYIFYHSGFLSNFVLSLKNRGCPVFTVLIIYFLSFRIFEQLALALKNRVALIFSLH